MRGRWSFDETDWSSISTDAKDLVTKMLIVDPRERITAAQVAKHPWIVSNVTIKGMPEPSARNVRPIAGVQEKLRPLVAERARRKFKAAGKAVMLSNSLH